MFWVDDPSQLPELSDSKLRELKALGKRILAIPSDAFDAMLHRLNTEVSSRIDCTQCGNCCAKLNPPVLENEISALARHCGLQDTEFRQNYLYQQSDKPYAFIRQSPCLFLKDKCCSVYAARPLSCRDYPHLHQPGQKFRFVRTIAQYEICPIVYNVLELLKVELDTGSVSR